MKLSQKQGQKRCEFELREDTIWVKLKTFSSTKEWIVKLENIGDQTVTQRNPKTIGIIFTLLSGAFGLFFIAVNLADKKHTMEPWAVITIGLFYILISYIISMNPSKREIQIVGGEESLIFFLDSPSEEEVRKYVDEVIARSKEVIIQKYVDLDPDVPEEVMMNRLNWLRNQNVITDRKFTELKKEYQRSRLIN